jgi:hypothetical protein
MKRIMLAAILGFSFLLIAPASAAPVNLSIGGTVWYIWWKPAWTDARAVSNYYTTGVAALMYEDANNFKPVSNVMAGPIISIGFLDRWSIQSVLTMGKFRAKSQGISGELGIVSGAIGGNGEYKKYTRDILKWDSDTSIGCAVHRMVKIYAGFKAQGYRYKEDLQDILSGAAYLNRKIDDDVKAYGCGLGLGLNIPLGADFYLQMGASGIALWSFESIDVNNSQTYIYSTGGGGLDYFILKAKKGHYFSYGGTASLGIAYNIEKINTAISIGGRYQLLFNRQKFKNLLDNNAAMNIVDKQYDHFFGVTLSAIYTFHIGKKA